MTEIVFTGALSDALASNLILPGSRVLLRAGTHAGNLTCSISGTAEARTTIMPYPGEAVIIDGTLTITGSYLDIIGIEFIDSTFVERESAQETSSPTDIGTLRSCLDVRGDYVTVAGCRLHDYAGGYGTDQTKTGNKFLENIVTAIGWKNPANTYGHGIYTGCNSGNVIEIARNILIDNFGYGLHLYNVSCYGFDIHDNIIANNGAPFGRYYLNMLLGGGGVVSGCAVTDNWCYYPPTDPPLTNGRNKVGYGLTGSVTDTTITGNWFAGGDYAFELAGESYSPTMTGNTITGNLLGFVQGDYPDNTYADPGAQVMVRECSYIGAAIVGVYNPAGANTVAVDLTSVTGLAASDQVRVRNAQDYANDVQTLTLDANKRVTVNMQAVNRTVAAPVGWDAAATTFPSFGAFVIEKVI